MDSSWCQAPNQPNKAIETQLNAWIKSNIPLIKTGEKSEARRVFVKNGNSIIVVGSTFFNETFSKNIKNKHLKRTITIAKEYSKWLPNAKWIFSEKANHHDGWYDVYEVTYKGERIRAKVKSETKILYTMRLL